MLPLAQQLPGLCALGLDLLEPEGIMVAAGAEQLSKRFEDDGLYVPKMQMLVMARAVFHRLKTVSHCGGKSRIAAKNLPHWIYAKLRALRYSNVCYRNLMC